MKILQQFYTALLAMALSAASLAGDVVSLEGDQPTSADIIQGFLGDQKASGDGVNYRGIRMKDATKGSGCNVENLSVAIQIQFAFNSYELETMGKDTVSEVAKAMNSAALENCKFMVEGHTDAVGSESYNQMLSEQRASTVTQFLQQANVSPSRLKAIGFGEAQPLNADNTAAAENRRVQFKVVNP